MSSHPLRWPVTQIVKLAFEVTCRIDKSHLSRIPQRGPYIVAANHVNFLEAPILFTQLYPRKITAVAKTESWDNPLFNFLFKVWGIVPIHRGTVESATFNIMRQLLDEKYLLGIFPEGTRSYNGKLLKGMPGIALLCSKAHAPVLPLVTYGGEDFWKNLKRLRRTDFFIRAGNPFEVDFGNQRLNREVMQQVTDEIMYQMASILPPAYRGVYADLENATETYLRFSNPALSNLAIARSQQS